MTLSAQPASTVPTAGLLASLGVWTWIAADCDGAPLGIVLLAHPPVRSPDETPEGIERCMRGIADALGLAEADVPLADIGPRVTIHTGSRVLLHPDGTRFVMQLPVHPRFVRLLLNRREVAVAVGLDPLAHGSAQEDADRYIDAGLAAHRLLFGKARAQTSERLVRRPCLRLIPPPGGAPA